MTIRMKAALAVLAGATLLGGCATGPYYDGYRYDPAYGYGYYDYGPGYSYGPGYYAPGYYGYPAYGPSVGFGITYIDRDRGHRHGHRDRHGRDRDPDGRRDRGPDREHGNPLRRGGRMIPEMPSGGGYDWRNDHGQNSPG